MYVGDITLALASSRAVTHFCRSTSEEARRWKVCVPPPLLKLINYSAQNPPIPRGDNARIIFSATWFILGAELLYESLCP